MTKDRIKLSAGGGLILLALVLLFLHYRVRPPFEPAVHEALGRVMAEEALRLVSGGGSLILIHRDTKTAAGPAVDAQLYAFYKTVGSRARISLTNLIKVDPLRVPDVPSGDFWTLEKNANENDVIVSFMGPPTFSEAQQSKLGSKIPKVVTLATGPISRRVDLATLFKRGLIQVAIIDREGGSKPNLASGSGDSRTLFDALYSVITPSSGGQNQ